MGQVVHQGWGYIQWVLCAERGGCGVEVGLFVCGMIWGDDQDCVWVQGISVWIQGYGCSASGPWQA